VSDLPFSLPPGPAVALASAVDRERKIDRALEALGPLVDRDVAFVGAGPDEIARWTAAGARAAALESLVGDAARELPDASADAIVCAWSGFRGVDAAELAAADRILRPGGRLIVVHDYGRDDVSRLRGELPEYGEWSRRDGPFLSNGFRVRVVHSFWTFDTLEAARGFLAEAFGPAGVALGADLKRPRLTWNVALYHRTRGDTAVIDDSAAGEPRPARQRTGPDAATDRA
jgi:SAM-dependent methyltransferase